jgi:tetratricopeptide (TPR) repeat protein
MQPSPEQTQVPPLPVAAAAPPAPGRRRAGSPLWRWRWPLAFATGVAIVTAVFWPQLRPRFERLRAMYFVGQAVQRWQADDLPGALERIDRALEISPGDLEWIEYRAAWRLATGDLPGAVADLDAAIEKNPNYAGFYLRRSQARYIQGRHDDALADATRAIELRPDWDSMPLNNRAYLRANVGRELEEALADIERALHLLSADDSTTKLSYLDTRAFILHRLGRHEDALKDMEEAIRMADAEYAAREKRLQLGPWDAREKRELYAVLHRHRGLILQALGRTEEGQRDLARAQELGYDPGRGVF